MKAQNIYTYIFNQNQRFNLYALAL